MSPSRTESEARIQRQLEQKRAELQKLVVTDRDQHVRWPGDGRVIVVAKGRRLPSDHVLVHQYPDRFRPLTEREIKWALRSAENHWRLAAGL